MNTLYHQAKHMRISLAPTSHPEIGEIVIDDALLSIGREKKPFSALPATTRRKLSRRHARIFREHDRFYLLDLASANGTLINEKLVNGTPVALKNADQICFAGTLKFDVRFPYQEIAEDQPQPSETTLSLIPATEDNGIETIEISRFPFLVSRTEQRFARYACRYPKDVRRISRRHAMITLAGTEIYVEDLGSPNGTAVSNERLQHRARQLVDGDRLSFGSDRFSYRVQINTPLSVAMSPSGDHATPIPRSTDEDAPRTIFTTSATSFLHVFCTDSGEQQGRKLNRHFARTPGHLAAKLAPGATGCSSTPSNSKKRAYKRSLLLSLVVVGSLCLAFTGFYIYGEGRREIKALSKSERHTATAIAAAQYLKTHPNDSEVATWGRVAMIKAVLPMWSENLDNKRFDEASSVLKEALIAHRAIPDCEDLFDVLQWATSVEAHIAERGGTAASFDLFKHAEPMRRLVEEWSVNKARYQQLLTEVLTYYPPFEQLHAIVQSHLRALSNEQSLIGNAVADLLDAITSQLRTEQPKNIHALVDRFTSKYPRVVGLDALRDDATTYATLLQHLEEGDIAALVRLSNDLTFLTPLFQEELSAKLRRTLPAPGFIEQYNTATSAWRDGDHVRSRQILASLQSGPFREPVLREIARQNHIVSDHNRLLSSTNDPQYGNRLLAFRASLKDADDVFFLEQIAPKYETHKARELKRLASLIDTAEDHWLAYENDGGLVAVTRVEAKVSQRFQIQAQRLSDAYQTISTGIAIYNRLGLPLPRRCSSLQKNLGNEIKRQRRSLEDLHLVLTPTLLDAKLDLLPSLDEETP